MSTAIKFTSAMNASNQTVGGVSGVFLAGRTFDSGDYAVLGCRVHQSSTGFYYDFELYTGGEVYLDATELSASAQTVSGLGAGVFIAAVAGQGGTPSVDGNGNASNIYQCVLNGGNGARGRSGVS